MNRKKLDALRKSMATFDGFQTPAEKLAHREESIASHTEQARHMMRRCDAVEVWDDDEAATVEPREPCGRCLSCVPCVTPSCLACRPLERLRAMSATQLTAEAQFGHAFDALFAEKFGAPPAGHEQHRERIAAVIAERKGLT